MRCTRAMSLVVGTAAAVGVLSACGSDDAPGPGADAAPVVAGRPSLEVTGDTTYFVVPTGRIDLTVGAPVDAVGEREAEDGEAHEAPDGGRFVPVGWTYTASPTGVDLPTFNGVDLAETELGLTAGDDEVDLGSPYDVVRQGRAVGGPGGGVWYVPVTGDATDVTLSATYDGLTQTADPASGDRDAGAAAGYYEEPRTGDLACPSTGWGAGARLTCTLKAPQRWPYLPGEGWAADGRTWLLVPFTSVVSAVEVDGESRGVAAVTASASAEGATTVSTDGAFAPDPDNAGGFDDDPERTSDRFALDAPADTEAVRVRLSVEPQSGETVVLERSLDLR